MTLRQSFFSPWTPLPLGDFLLQTPTVCPFVAYFRVGSREAPGESGGSSGPQGCQAETPESQSLPLSAPKEAPPPRSRVKVPAREGVPRRSNRWVSGLLQGGEPPSARWVHPGRDTRVKEGGSQRPLGVVQWVPVDTSTPLEDLGSRARAGRQKDELGEYVSFRVRSGFSSK